MNKYIEFGMHNGSPILWEILGRCKNGNILIVSDRILFYREFDTLSESNKWVSSSLKRYLNSQFISNFTSKEFSYISYTSGGEIICVPSEEEIQYMNNHVKGTWWWLRTPSTTSTKYTRVIDYQGRLDCNGVYDHSGGVLPALSLHKEILQLPTEGVGTISFPYKIN